MSTTQIVPQGQVNLAGLIVPGAIVQTVSPAAQITGVPTNVEGHVGTASWGPVNIATVVGGNTDYAALFGPVLNRMYDLGTSAMVAEQQDGAQNIVHKLVRVTDGTDTAASGSYATSQATSTETVAGTPKVGDVATLTFTPVSGDPIVVAYPVPSGPPTAAQIAAGLNALCAANAALRAVGFGFSASGDVISICGLPAGWTVTPSVTGTSPTTTLTGATTTASAINLTLTGIYTGSLGNGVQYTLQPGTKAGSTKLVISRPNVAPEVFDSLTGAGNALWQNIASVVNNGQSATRGPSRIAIASAGPGAAAGPVDQVTTALAGGSDGAAGVTDATLLGADSDPRTGLYALRSQACSVVNMIDSSTDTYWSDYVAFGLSEGVLVYFNGVPDDTITAAPTELGTAGVDSYAVVAMFGDWIEWWDTVNQTVRLLGPATFAAGLRAALSPEQSTLNKQLAGILGSQKSETGSAYAYADLQTILQSCFDVIANPSAGGAYWGLQGGINTSSAGVANNGDNYTMMTNFLARSIARWAGSNVGELQNPTQRGDVVAAGNNFLNGLRELGMIGNSDGTLPYSVQCNDSTTSPQLAAEGYEIVAVQVQYLAVIKFFIVNLQGGQTVSVSVSDTAPAWAQAA